MFIGISELGQNKKRKIAEEPLKAGQDSLQQSITSIISIRQRLHTEHSKLENTETCPYCGMNWKDKDALENHYLEAEENLKQLLASDGKQYDEQYKTLQLHVKTNLMPTLKAKIDTMQKNPLLNIYNSFQNREQFVRYMDLCKKTMVAIFSDNIKDITKEKVEEVISQIEQLEHSIPEEYLQANGQYDFVGISRKYFEGKTIPEVLTEFSIEKKKQYLNYKYFQSFDNLTVKLNKLKDKKEKLSQLQNMMKEYSKALKNAIAKYEKQIIDQIEIPFFVYSSRLLQSYQGGQGVLMKNDGKSVRFTAPGSEHDILYTMSSGQLSAVLLSFSLAMNKIYAGNGIKTVFVDDPIQCMDDINMISFVELLRCEFSDSQIIISTHEESFSNFIRYKFKKYNIETQAIALKDA